jgi:hypothetical protein
VEDELTTREITSTLINPWLGLDPFILVEFIVEDEEVKLSLRYGGGVQEKDVAQTLREVSSLIRSEYVDE